jgi:hypothetical protein
MPYFQASHKMEEYSASIAQNGCLQPDQTFPIE